MKWTARVIGGVVDFGDYNRKSVRKYVQENPNAIFEMSPVLPESRKMRRYFEGGLIPMFCFVSGMDWKDSKQRELAHEIVKMEFNPEFVEFGGQSIKIAKSTKGRDNLNAVTERLYNYLVENGASHESLDHKAFKNWRDTIFPYGGPENWIDYCLEMQWLERPHA